MSDWREWLLNDCPNCRSNLRYKRDSNIGVCVNCNKEWKLDVREVKNAP